MRRLGQRDGVGPGKPNRNEIVRILAREGEKWKAQRRDESMVTAQVLSGLIVLKKKSRMFKLDPANLVKRYLSRISSTEDARSKTLGHFFMLQHDRVGIARRCYTK
jgi:hypothetical protein